MNIKQEFTAFGFSIEKITIIYGAFLILWGLIVSFVSGSTSITSYIPSMFGWPMLFLGALALKLPDYKKILMHIVVILGFWYVEDIRVGMAVIAERFMEMFFPEALP